MKKEICTIYLLTNKINNKIYVGQTWMTCEERMGRKGKGYYNSTYLYAAILKYGSENFEYEILDECNNQSEADLFEEAYIKMYCGRDSATGYNIKSGGSAGRHSDETKKKISASQIGKLVSEKTRQLLSKINKGVKRKPHTDEWKQNNSSLIKERHRKNGHPMIGKHHSDAAKLKISNFFKGRKVNPEIVKRRAFSKRNIEKEQLVIDAYLFGTLISDIVKTMNVRINYIYRVLRRHKIKFRQAQVTKAKKKIIKIIENDKK